MTTLQYLLRCAGYGTLAADGVFGTATETTVRQFQHRVKLAEDGIAGEQRRHRRSAYLERAHRP